MISVEQSSIPQISLSKPEIPLPLLDESVVIRLNIAVDDSSVVSDFKRGTAVGNDACRDDPVVRTSLFEMLSSASWREQLHHNVTLALFTRDIVDGKGETISWDRQLLIKITETIEKAGGFSPISWENRSIVEVAGPIKSKGWFLHAITAETWLLKLKIRVPRRAFTKNQLESLVTLPTLNQMEDIEQYGNEPRVRARVAGAWMELELQPHTLAELDTPKFWKWFDDAMAVFLGKPQETEPAPEASDPEKHSP